MKLIAASLATAILASGCASSLKTFDTEGKPTVGIPISTPVLVEIVEQTTYEVIPGKENEKFKIYCTPETNSKFQFLALGERSYIAFDPALFGKGEFKVEFNDAGALKSVSLNSDATANADKVGELLGTVLPFLGKPQMPTDMKAAATESTAQKNKEKYCINKGTRVTDVIRTTIKDAKK